MNIVLVDADNVVDTNGTVTFKSNAAITQVGNSPAIEVVNGATQANAAGAGGSVVQVNDIAPVNGVVSFTIDATGPVKVVPVVYVDSTEDGSNLLNLGTGASATNPQAPTESFGIGGLVTYLPPAATNTANGTAGRVGFLDKATNRVGIDEAAATVGDYSFTATDRLYTYDSNDTFSIGGIPATIDEFEAALSRGDGLDPGAYSTSSGAVSVFNISADGPTAPTTVAAEKGTGQGTNDIAVVITPSAPATVSMYDSFVIQRAPVTGGTDEANDGTIGTYATVATVAVSADEDSVAGTFTWTDMDVAVGVYRYRAAGVIDGDTPSANADYTADASNESSTEPAADVTAPTAQYAAVRTDANLSQVADQSDELRVIFDEAITINQATALLRIRETDGGGDDETFDISTSQASFSTNASAVVIGGTTYAAGRILTVSFTAKPTPIATVSGGDNELDWDDTPQISNAAGITDGSGNAFAPTATAVSRHVAAPTITAAAGDESDDTITLTYDVPVRCSNTADVRAQFVWDDATAPVSPTAITCNGTTTVVLTFADGELLDADDTGSITYTQSATASNRVEGLNSRTATSPETDAAAVAA